MTVILGKDIFHLKNFFREAGRINFLQPRTTQSHHTKYFLKTKARTSEDASDFWFAKYTPENAGKFSAAAFGWTPAPRINFYARKIYFANQNACTQLGPAAKKNGLWQ
jgi:hypothetical protein